MSKLGTTIAFLGALVILLLADASLTRSSWWKPAETPAPKTVITPGTTVGSSSESTSSSGTRSSGAVATDLARVFTALGYETANTREKSILEKVVPGGTAINGSTLLKNNDRVVHISWVDHPEVKLYYSALKEALHGSFTDRMIDLVDETQERPGKPVRNVLSFLDPNIHEERLLFVRVRQRLFEFHIAKDQEEAAQELLDALTE